MAETSKQRRRRFQAADADALRQQNLQQRLADDQTRNVRAQNRKTAKLLKIQRQDVADVDAAKVLTDAGTITTPMDVKFKRLQEGAPTHGTSTRLVTKDEIPEDHEIIPTGTYWDDRKGKRMQIPRDPTGASVDTDRFREHEIKRHLALQAGWPDSPFPPPSADGRDMLDSTIRYDKDSGRWPYDKMKAGLEDLGKKEWQLSQAGRDTREINRKGTIVDMIVRDELFYAENHTPEELQKIVIMGGRVTHAVKGAARYKELFRVVDDSLKGKKVTITPPGKSQGLAAYMSMTPKEQTKYTEQLSKDTVSLREAESRGMTLAQFTQEELALKEAAAKRTSQQKIAEFGQKQQDYTKTQEGVDTKIQSEEEIARIKAAGDLQVAKLGGEQEIHRVRIETRVKQETDLHKMIQENAFPPAAREFVINGFIAISKIDTQLAKLNPTEAGYGEALARRNALVGLLTLTVKTSIDNTEKLNVRLQDFARRLEMSQSNPDGSDAQPGTPGTTAPKKPPEEPKEGATNTLYGKTWIYTRLDSGDYQWVPQL